MRTTNLAGLQPLAPSEEQNAPALPSEANYYDQEGASS
jgi:hypothetical protein